MTNLVLDGAPETGPPNLSDGRPLLRALAGVRSRWLLLVAVMAAAVVGAGVAQRGIVPLAVALLLCGTAVAICIGRLGAVSLGIWALVSGLANPFLRYPLEHPYLTFDRVWLIGIGASLVLVSAHVKWSRTARNLAIAMGVFCAVYGVLSFISTTATGAVGPIEIWIDAILLPSVLFVVTARLVTTVEQVRRLATAVVAGGVVISAIAITEALFGFELATRVGSAPRLDTITGVTRVSGPYPVPEVLGLVLLICLAMTLYWMQTKGRAWYLVGGAAALVQLIAIGLTFFRAAWIGAILIVIAAFAIRPSRVGRLVTAATVASIAFFFAFSFLEQVPVFVSRVTSDAAVANVYARVAIDIQSLELFAQAPLTGVGANQYTAAASGHLAPIWAGVQAIPFAHNSYLGLLAEQGVVGFLPFVAVTVLALRAIREVGRLGAVRDDILIGACAAGAGLAYLVMSLTLTMLPYGSSNAFLALLLGVVCGRLNAKASETAAEGLPARGGAHGGA
jgi:O-antigen ligase